MATDDGAGKGPGAVQALEKEVASLKEENLMLIKDIEAMCMQTSKTSFSSSSVVSERISGLELELSKCRAMLRDATEERDSTREDAVQLRKAKRDVDNSWRQERARADALEKELAFFQEQSQQAILERDDALYEADVAKGSIMRLEKSLRETQADLDEALRHREDLEKRLEAALSEAAGLKARVEELSELLPIKDELREVQETLEKERRAAAELSSAKEALEAEAKRREEELGQERADLATARRQLKDSKAAREAEREAHAEVILGLEQRLRSSEERQAEASKGGEEARKALAAATAEAEAARAEANEACEARAAAQEGLEAAKAAAADAEEQVRVFAEQSTDLKQRLALATNEKVQSTMKLAEQKQENLRLMDLLEAARQRGRN